MGPGEFERNECVCAHLALGMEWAAQGRPRRIPNKSIVMDLLAQVRSAEFQQAQMFMNIPDKPTMKSGAKLFPLPRDVMSPRHDRNFQVVILYLSDTENCPE